MGMRLLSPPQGKSLLEANIALQEARVIELDKLIVAKRKELNDLDSQYLRSLSETGLKGAEEEKYWKDKIEPLIREVEGLESRRKSALVPLVERETQVEDRERALLKREEMVAIRESENDSERQMLEDRLDDVSEREEEATKYSIILNNRDSAVAIQERQVKERMNALTAILIESLEDVKKSQAESARYKAMLKGRDVSIAEREKYVEEKEKSFANREEAILDKYRTLQRTITEVNLKNERSGLPDTKRPE